MTKRTLIFILVILAIISAGTIPFAFKSKTESINQTIDLSASILSSLAAVITLYIALLLFNKYGVETSLLDQCSKQVFALLEEIKRTNFSIGGSKISFWVSMSDPFKYNTRIEEYYSQKLVFSETYISSLNKIFELSNSAFIPPEIFKKVDRLQFYILAYDVDETKLRDYEKVVVVGGQKIENPKFGRFNSADMTLFEFLTILDDIRTEVKGWIQSKSALPIKLNL